MPAKAGIQHWRGFTSGGTSAPPAHFFRTALPYLQGAFAGVTTAELFGPLFRADGAEFWER